MAEMRIYEKYRAQNLRDYQYTWDTTYSRILSRAADAFNSGVVTGEDNGTFTVSADSPNWTTNSVEFILTRSYRYNTVIDGIARGNVKAKIGAWYGSSSSAATYGRATINLKTRTAAGVTTQQAAVTTNTISVTGVTENGWTYSTVEFPFWLDCDAIEVKNTDRLLLVVDYQGYRAYSGINHDHNMTYYNALGTDDLYIELPIVP